MNKQINSIVTKKVNKHINKSQLNKIKYYLHEIK